MSEFPPAKDPNTAKGENNGEKEDVKSGILAAILTANARERLSRVALVRPDRAHTLQELLINAAQSGQLRGSSPTGQVTESDLVQILEQLDSREGKSRVSNIRYCRKQDLQDSEDDY